MIVYRRRPGLMVGMWSLRQGAYDTNDEEDDNARTRRWVWALGMLMTGCLFLSCMFMGLHCTQSRRQEEKMDIIFSRMDIILGKMVGFQQWMDNVDECMEKKHDWMNTKDNKMESIERIVSRILKALEVPYPTSVLLPDKMKEMYRGESEDELLQEDDDDGYPIGVLIETILSQLWNIERSILTHSSAIHDITEEFDKSLSLLNANPSKYERRAPESRQGDASIDSEPMPARSE